MPKRKKVSVKKKKRTTTRKKTTRKKVVRKKVVRKKTSTRKKTTKKKASKRKVAKKTARKKVARKKKVAKKATKKKRVSKSQTKKKVAKKKVVRKKAAKKKVAKKKATKKKAAKKKPAKKPAAKKAAIKKKPAKKKRRKKSGGKRIVASRRMDLADGPAGGFVPYDRSQGDTYMGKQQKIHFKELLRTWRTELREEMARTVDHLKDEPAHFPDPSDRATQESEFSLELRTRDRERKLISKINKALQAIDYDDYGYCETCGIEIGLNRLEARPTARMCIDCKTLHEIRERQSGG